MVSKKSFIHIIFFLKHYSDMIKQGKEKGLDVLQSKKEKFELSFLTFYHLWLSQLR